MKTVWLSHVLESKTPLYGGAEELEILVQKSINSGDSCNTSIIKLPSHAGTHVDVPFHFLSEGATVDSYPPESWEFKAPRLLDAFSAPGRLITPNDLSLPSKAEKGVDIVLIRTGFERYRQEDVYWKNGPGLMPELADYLRRSYPDLRAVGMDFISISSMAHREQGRAAHETFLGQGLLLFEDMRLLDINEKETVIRIVALPLRFKNGDGGPCTIIGSVSSHPKKRGIDDI